VIPTAMQCRWWKKGDDGPGHCATIKLSLRPTLVRSVMLLGRDYNTDDADEWILPVVIRFIRVLLNPPLMCYGIIKRKVHPSGEGM
jgi:hypothetical protein